MSRNHYRAYSRRPSGFPPMEGHIGHYHPRDAAEMIAVRHHHQKPVVSEHEWLAHQARLRVQKQEELKRALAEEDRAKAKYILKERQRVDPKFAYRMRDPVYAKQKFTETVYAVEKERMNLSPKSVRFALAPLPAVPGHQA